MRGDLYRCRLILEQLISELRRDSEFGQPIPRFLRKMISNLDIDVVWRNDFFSRPALLDDIDQLGRDIDAPFVFPLILEPIGQFLGGIGIDDVNVELALSRQARQSQIAASEITDSRQILIGTKKQIEFRVQLVPQKQLNHQFAGF